MKRFDICALGELLIDFTENGTSSQGNPLMEANPGGAPCNVLSMMSRQGKKTAFIGKVGNDIFGRQLKAAVEEVGINTEMKKSIQRWRSSKRSTEETESFRFTEIPGRT